MIDLASLFGVGVEVSASDESRRGLRDRDIARKNLSLRPSLSSLLLKLEILGNYRKEHVKRLVRANFRAKSITNHDCKICCAFEQCIGSAEGYCNDEFMLSRMGRRCSQTEVEESHRTRTSHFLRQQQSSSSSKQMYETISPLGHACTPIGSNGNSRACCSRGAQTSRETQSFWVHRSPEDDAMSTIWA